MRRRRQSGGGKLRRRGGRGDGRRGSPRGRGDVGFVPLDPDLDRGWGRETREWGWGSCGGEVRGVGGGYGLGFGGGEA